MVSVNLFNENRMKIYDLEWLMLEIQWALIERFGHLPYHNPSFN